MVLKFTGERIVPAADNCEPLFAEKMYVEHSARYRLAAQFADGARVLDVGCGVGYGALLLAEAGAKEVVAFDVSAEAIAHAREFYHHPAIRFLVGDATNFTFEGSFDLITCFELIEHVDNQEAVFDCIGSAVSEDGILVMSTPRALEQKRVEVHTTEYSEEEFRAAFVRHFRHCRMMVENNHFASLVTDGTPKFLDQVHCLHDQFGLDQADYLIGVGTSGDPERLDSISPVIVLGNEAYVKLLERDEAILQARRIELENELLTTRDLLQACEARLHEEHASFERLQNDFVTTRDLLQLRDGRLDERQAVVERLQNEVVITRASLQVWESRLREERVAGEKLQVKLHEEHVLGQKLQFDLLNSQLQAQSLQDAIAARKRKRERRWFNRFIRGPVKAARIWARRSTQRIPTSSEIASAATPVEAHSVLASSEMGPIGSTVSAVATVPVAYNSSRKSPEILFFIGCWEGESKRYRVYNVANALALAGYDVDVMPFADLGRIVEENISPKVVVLFRAPEEPFTDAYFDYARDQGIRTFFDVDDLVFNSDIIDEIVGFQVLSEEEKVRYRDGVARYRRLLLRCDGATLTTGALARAVSDLGVAAHVVPNSWNYIQRDVSEKLLGTAIPREEFVIGFFSGSKTHDRDFQEAASALLRLMQDLSQVRLLIVGELEIGSAFSAFGDRIDRLPFMPYQEQMREMYRCDVIIVPLELENVFNEGKSELKWFEAAMVETPCVVSPTEPYIAAIRNGETGFLAATDAEWYDNLYVLATQPDVRARIGAAAREAALINFGPDQVRLAAEAAYQIPAPVNPLPFKDAASKRIDWIVPGLIIGGGGHRNILRVAYFLERAGHDVRLTFTNTKHSAEELRALLHEHFYPFEGQVRRYDGTFRYTDALFATHWSTVEVALRARGLAKEIMYFVQDFEPLFAPMGTEYILAENTYRKGLYCITSGPWCEELLKREYGADADHFKFPIDRDVYFPRPRSKHERNLIFFAKPEMPRRCFDLGVMMLREFHRLVPSVEIIMFGSRDVDTSALGFPAKVQGVLPTIDDLAQAYSNADLGICFSTTNPSLVPYEMMACGLPVVDLGRPGNEVNYGGRFDIALLADPDPAVMAVQVRNLLESPKERSARSEAGIEFSSQFPTELEMSRRVEELILSRLAR